MSPPGSTGPDLPSSPGQVALAAAAFVAEMAMLGGLAWGGSQLGTSSLAHVVLAVVLPVAAAVVWGLWCAPRASRRLARGPRWAVKVTLFAATLVLLLLAGPQPQAGIYGLVMWLLFVVSLPSDRPAAPRPA
jgi:hypothetical protein